MFVKADIQKLMTIKVCRETGCKAIPRIAYCRSEVIMRGLASPLAATGEYPIDGWDKVIAINSQVCSMECVSRFRPCCDPAAAAL